MEFLQVNSSPVFFPNFLRPQHVSNLTNFSTTRPISLPPFTTKESSLAACRKDKVVFVLGSTGTGKSKLAIDLATHFNGEVINSDKMQVYDGLNIITNKVTEEECAGIPHHLIGGVHPDADFTASDFRRAATRCVESVLSHGKLPIIAGGSNSYIEELVDADGMKFRTKYDCCFLWVDVDLPVLHSFVSTRVDKMVEMGLVEEARGMFTVEADYSKGIRRSIGMPELDRYFHAERSANGEDKERLLNTSIDEIKGNTCKLTFRQLQKLRRLSTLWDVKKVDATEAFIKQGKEVQATWNRVAKEPSIKIVDNFLEDKTTFNNASPIISSIAPTKGTMVTSKEGCKSATVTAAAAAAAATATTISGEQYKAGSVMVMMVGTTTCTS